LDCPVLFGQSFLYGETGLNERKINLEKNEIMMCPNSRIPVRLKRGLLISHLLFHAGYS